jgi:hypothetical protein
MLIVERIGNGPDVQAEISLLENLRILGPMILTVQGQDRHQDRRD